MPVDKQLASVSSRSSSSGLVLALSSVGVCPPARLPARRRAPACLGGWLPPFFLVLFYDLLWKCMRRRKQESKRRARKKCCCKCNGDTGNSHTHTHTVSDSSDTHTHTPGDICLTTKQFELMGLGSWGGKAHSLAHANRNNNGAQLLSGLRTIQSICSAWQIVKLKETLLTICLMPS